MLCNLQQYQTLKHQLGTIIPDLAVDQYDEILVLCDLFKLLLASVDTFLLFRSNAGNAVLMSSVTMALSERPEGLTLVIDLQK
jgi:hypothetical protein